METPFAVGDDDPRDTAADAPRMLRVGERVTSTNRAPVFASDPRAGDAGTVVQATGTDGSASYLVRWKDDSESWCTRENLDPTRRAASAVGAHPAPGARPAPAPDGPAHPLLVAFQRFSLLIFLLPLAPVIVRALRHPTATSLVVAVAVLGLIVAGVARARRARAAR